MKNSPWRVAAFGLLLLLLGFAVGYGYHTRQSNVGPTGTKKASRAITAPVAKGLRVSPDDRYLAFAGVNDGATLAARFVLELPTMKHSSTLTPAGWLDFPTQWSSDGHNILFEREKILHPVDEATAGGLYSAPVAANDFTAQQDGAARADKARLLTAGAAPAGEKIVTGFWTPDSRLIIKTRREPKALFEVRGGEAILVDRTAGTYYQNRAVRENGRTVYYVVRDDDTTPGRIALYRVAGSGARRVGAVASSITWAYLSGDARWLIYCRPAPTGDNWQWTLYAVTPTSARQVKQAIVPGDAIGVYWSPDFRTVLGANGKALWTIAIPSLQVRQLGKRNDWNADEAAWLHLKPAVIIAANGRLWQIETSSGSTRELWRFPAPFWR